MILISIYKPKILDSWVLFCRAEGIKNIYAWEKQELLQPRGLAFSSETYPSVSSLTVLLALACTSVGGSCWFLPGPLPTHGPGKPHGQPLRRWTRAESNLLNHSQRLFNYSLKMSSVYLRGALSERYLEFWMVAWNFGELCSSGKSCVGSSQLVLSALC